ncbi:hypothetical protein CMU21_00520 [Elizabethkingia anophelis]|nr:hypothetical protein [Elizabethkingia anophelis]
MNNKNSEYYDKEFERKKIIQELINKEEFLRKERNKITNEQPWYKKAQNVIAIFAVMFPILISYIITQNQKDNKEISIKYSSLEPIIVNSENIKEKLLIKYDSTEVRNISKIRFIIQNSGNIDVTKNDFEDGPIRITLSNINNNIPNDIRILQVAEVQNAGQQNAKLKLFKHNSFEYTPSLLNKDDEVIIDAFILNVPSLEVLTNGKILNGKIRKPEILDKKEIELGYKTFVLSLNNFFGYKLITIIILTLLFALLALSSTFIFAMVSNSNLEPRGLGIIMGLSTSVMSIFNIILIISVSIYV